MEWSRFLEIHPALTLIVAIIGSIIVPIAIKIGITRNKSKCKLYRISKRYYDYLFDNCFQHIKLDSHLFPNAKPFDVRFASEEANGLSLFEILRTHKGNFVFIGEGGSGKTTSLLYIWERFCKIKKELPLYVLLNEFITAPDKNKFIREYIRKNYKGLILEDVKMPIILLLDGFNEILRDSKILYIIEEIKYLCQFDNIRIVSASRSDFTNMDTGLSSFKSYMIQPLSATDINNFWQSKESLITVSLPDNWEELLSTPMMLTLYANNCAIRKNAEYLKTFNFKFKIAMTKGEVIYNYLLCQVGKTAESPYDFIDYFCTYVALFFIAPFIAHKMECEGKFDILKEQCDEIVSSVISAIKEGHIVHSYLRELYNCRINFPTPTTGNYSEFIQKIKQEKIIDILIHQTCLLTEIDKSNKYGFRHQYFRDFLSALCIVNAIEESNGIPVELSERMLPKEITEMLADYYGEYENKEYCKINTRLHKLLDNLRDKDHALLGYSVNNILNVWRVGRNDRIIGEDLSNLDLRRVLLNGVIFSDNGVTTFFDGSRVAWNTFMPQSNSPNANSIVYNKDGNRVLFGCNDGIIRELTIDKNAIKTIKIFGEIFDEKHSSRVTSVAYGRGKEVKKIFSVSLDETLKEWDYETGNLVHTYKDKGHTDGIICLAVSQDGKRVLTSSCDYTIREWDTEKRKCMQVFNGHKDYVSSVTYSLDPDERKILSGSLDGTVIEWNRLDGSINHQYEKRHEDRISSVRYSHDGDYILSSSEDMSIIEWSVQTKTFRKFEIQHQDAINMAVYNTKNENLVLSAAWDDTIKEWDRTTGECKRTFNWYRGHKYATSAQYSPDGQRILSTSYNGTINEHDCETEERLWTYPGKLALDLGENSSVDGCSFKRCFFKEPEFKGILASCGALVD